MSDKNKTKIRLTRKLEEKKKRIVELETGESSRRHAVKELKADDGRLEQYLDLVDVLVVVIEADQTISLINRKGCEILQCNREELIGDNLFDMFLMENDRERMRAEFQQVICGEMESVNADELPVCNKRGEERWLCWHTKILKNQDGKITGAICSAQDITERKRADEERNHYRDHVLDIVAGSAHVLLTCPDINDAVDRALAILGVGTDVDRVYIFENHSDPITGELLASQCFEWSKAGVISQKDNPLLINASYRDFFPRWQTDLSLGHTIKGFIRDFPAEEREFLERQDILSLLVVPVMIEGHFWGFLGFDDCHEEKVWTESEESILVAAANNIVNAIERKRAEAALQERVKELNCLYSIADMIDKTDTIEEIYRQTADLMQNGLHYPEHACTRITCEDQEFQAGNFQETAWKISADMIVHGKRIGVVEAYCLEEMPERDEGPFYKEERDLVNAVAERLGKATELKKYEKDLERLIAEALSEIKALNGLLPICASCKKIRNDEGYWEQIESYIGQHSEAEFSHGICPDCARKLYPEFYQEK